MKHLLAIAFGPASLRLGGNPLIRLITGRFRRCVGRLPASVLGPSPRCAGTPRPSGPARSASSPGEGLLVEESHC